jgi:alanine-glyoxylate transaminase / serine-glyoxylate transaminase / serine-pyruvate transaminase
MMDSKIAYSRLNPPERTLLGPDLSNPSPRARQGLIAILEGANDPSFLKVLDEALALLRHLWGTGNEDTFLIPGVEENALEAALVNLLQPGDTCVVVVNGFFGERMALAAERLGAEVVRLRAEPGKAVTTHRDRSRAPPAAGQGAGRPAWRWRYRRRTAAFRPGRAGARA